uniref:Uncharacterized protein n=1 Tax=Nicotiana tabacum TaxID=4097 RepID=A0A1S3XAW9_TOBAC
MLRRSNSLNNLPPPDPARERLFHRLRREAEERAKIAELDIIVQPQPIKMAENEERPVIEVARPSLATHHNWKGEGEPRRMIKHKASGTLELDEVSAMRAEISKLTNQVAKMAMGQRNQMQQVQRMNACCEICGDGHMSDQCPVNPEFFYYVGQQGRGPMNQNINMGIPIIPTGGIIRISHEVGTRPLRINTGPKGTIINLKSHLNRGKIGQLAAQQNTRPAGALPRDTDKNPQVNAVTLRNGRELEEVLKRKKEKVTPQGELVPKTVVETEKESEESEKTPIARPPPPFPQRLKKKSDDIVFNKFLDRLSQIQLNLPLVDVLREIPKYAKYTKDIVANKRRLTEFETVALTE